MATGWAREGAVVDQIQDTITDGVESARARLPRGEGTLECIECGKEIPAGQEVMKGFFSKKAYHKE